MVKLFVAFAICRNVSRAEVIEDAEFLKTL